MRVMRMGLTWVVLLATVIGLVGWPMVPAEAGGVEAQAWEGFTRVAGEGRYETAVKTSERYFGSGAQTVLLATGENWADALCASALAGAYDAPLLLVRSRALPSVVADEIKRLAPARVVLLGGTAAIDDSVQHAVEGVLPSATVERIGGGTRYETASEVAKRFQEVVGTDWSGEVFVATGANFPDALGASAIAAHTRTPIVLTGKNSLPAVSADALRDLQPNKALILGGTGAIGSTPENAVKAIVASTQRFAGADRYDTCVKVVEYARSTWSMGVESLGMSSGANFPDALGAGAALGHVGQAQLLTGRSSLPSRTAAFLNSVVGQTSRVTVFGGTGAVQAEVLDQVRMIIDPGWQPPAGPFAAITASVSNAQPAQHLTVWVYVTCTDSQGRPVSGVQVSSKWNYKSVTHFESAVSGSDGVASMSRNIAGASLGYTVVIEVTATKDGVTRTATTSFTPQ